LSEALFVVVYLSVISVTTTLSNVLAVLDVLGGGGTGAPPVGISPAKIEPDSAHMSTSAIANRFIWFAPSEVEKKDAKIFT
jgi:hypothetical protein